MTFLTFFFLLFLIFILPKIIRLAIIVHRVRKQTRQVFDQMYGAAGANAHNPEPPRRKPGWSEPQPHRKKIDPAVGEYVKFQEITTTETTRTETDPSTGKTRSTTVIEQQITDAEWEEIP